MQVTIYSTLKWRLQTVELEFTDENTTWFDNRIDTEDIHKITDFDGGLLIQHNCFGCYPILIDGVTRADINYSHRKAKELLASYR
jgi:hypothetical protein